MRVGGGGVERDGASFIKGIYVPSRGPHCNMSSTGDETSHLL